MLRVPINSATPGMSLAIPLRHPLKPDHTLLQSGHLLDDVTITRLRQLGFNEIWIRYPGLEYMGRYINPQILEGQAKLANAISTVFDSVIAGVHARVDYAAYKELVKEFLNRLMEDPVAAVFLHEIGGKDKPLLRHSCSVAFLCLMMGLKLDGYLVAERRRLPASLAKNVESLGVGAMLHDVGMLEIDKAARERWDREGDESDPEWRRHVQIGYDMVKGHVEPSAAAAILHHHQRFDGKGFPDSEDENGEMQGLSGSRIHVFARIIATADLYDRLRHPFGEPWPRPAVRALKMMQRPEYAGRIDPMTYRALLAVAPPYAPGSLVTLTNGARGVVVEWSTDDPCRPVVQVIGDLAAAPEEGAPTEQFDLRQRHDLQIAIAEDQDVLKDNFYPAKPGAFSLILEEVGLDAA